MTDDIGTAVPARRGRPCSVCAMPTHERTALEVMLANGVSISRIARQNRAPSRDSIRNHLVSGHLPKELQESAERSHGLDMTSFLDRVHAIAQRARETAMEAQHQSNHAAVIRAGDAELRALQVLAHAGADHEADIVLDAASRNVFRAVVAVSKRDHTTAERIADELEFMGLVTLAEDVRNQDSGNSREITS